MIIFYSHYERGNFKFDLCKSGLVCDSLKEPHYILRNIPHPHDYLIFEILILSCIFKKLDKLNEVFIIRAKNFFVDSYIFVGIIVTNPKFILCLPELIRTRLRFALASKIRSKDTLIIPNLNAWVTVGQQFRLMGYNILLMDHPEILRNSICYELSVIFITHPRLAKSV